MKMTLVLTALPSKVVIVDILESSLIVNGRWLSDSYIKP